MVFRVFLFLVIICKTSYSEIIYNKNEIIVTKTDIELFKSIYKNETNISISDQYALKLYTLNIKKINQINQINNSIRDDIDNIIEKKFSNKNLKLDPIRAFIFYNEIQNQFVQEYFKKNFNYSNFKEISKNFKNLKVGLSLNKCLTIEELIYINENTEFLNKIYDFIMNKNTKISTIFKENLYDVCIGENAIKDMESFIFNYIKKQTESKVLDYLYS